MPIISMQVDSAQRLYSTTVAVRGAFVEMKEVERSYDNIRKLLQRAAEIKYAKQEGGPYPWVQDVFDDFVIIDVRGRYFQCDYEISADGNVSLSDADQDIEVMPRVVYDPAPPATSDGLGESAATAIEKKMDQDVGGGVDRDKIPAADFAGKNRSFPIVVPKDVSDAAASIGRAGENNYPSDMIRRRIIAIAKRKGAKFVAKLPKAWRPAEEAAAPGAIDIDMEFCPLIDLAESASAQIKLIAPGWGSSGYYSPTLLRKDGPSIFTAGTKMFWDHPTANEEAARPEGSLTKLAGELTENATYLEDGMHGPGLYARAKVFDRWASDLAEIKDHIGVSIRATGVARTGEAEGKRGPIIETLHSAKSVDFVTSPGAGGKVLQLFEAAGRTVGAAATQKTTGVVAGESNQRGDVATMTEQEIQALQEAKARAESAEAELAKFRLQTAAAAFVNQKLSGINIPDAMKKRIAESLIAHPVVKDGALDEVVYAAKIDEAVKHEAQYVSQITGTSRVVVGMGQSEAVDTSEADVVKALQSFGLSEAGAKAAVEARK